MTKKDLMKKKIAEDLKNLDSYKWRMFDKISNIDKQIQSLKADRNMYEDRMDEAEKKIKEKTELLEALNE